MYIMYIIKHIQTHMLYIQHTVKNLWVVLYSKHIESYKITKNILNATYHFDWLAGQIWVCDRRVIALHDIDAFARQGLDDWLVGLQRGHLVSFENEGAHATVQLTGQQ